MPRTLSAGVSLCRLVRRWSLRVACVRPWSEQQQRSSSGARFLLQIPGASTAADAGRRRILLFFTTVWTGRDVCVVVSLMVTHTEQLETCGIKCSASP